MDCPKPHTDNVKFRQAINYAIDSQTLLETIMTNVPEIETAPFSKKAFDYTSGLQPFTFSTDKAEQLLDEAVPSKDIEMTLFAGSGFYPKVKEEEEAIVSFLNNVGIKVKHTEMEFARFLTCSRTTTETCTLMDGSS